MSWLHLTHEDGTTETLGDVQQARKFMGQPYRTPDGKYVSESQLKAIDKKGE